MGQWPCPVGLKGPHSRHPMGLGLGRALAGSQALRTILQEGPRAPRQHEPHWEPRAQSTGHGSRVGQITVQIPALPHKSCDLWVKGLCLQYVHREDGADDISGWV